MVGVDHSNPIEVDKWLKEDGCIVDVAKFPSNDIKDLW